MSFMRSIWCAYRPLAAVALFSSLLTGCYAPLKSPAIPAWELAECYRTPVRTAGAPLNLAALTATPPADYILGPNDVLDIGVPGLFQGAEFRPLRLQVLANGQVQLPLAGPVRVGGMNLGQAQQAIAEAYKDYLNKPSISVSLAEKSSIGVIVLGEVRNPGVQLLAKYENDVGHALAAAGGLSLNASDVIEVHRRVPADVAAAAAPPPMPADGSAPAPSAQPAVGETGLMVFQIPLRGTPGDVIPPEQIILGPGDVVVVPSRRHEVFFVTGKVNPNNLVRFALDERERELGAGFVLPRDRDIDVVTAVAMAGYIDPIDSPTTVTVHRTQPDGRPFLIHVDLIRARYDRNATVLVQPGDIIYLNPDAAWWFRRTFDRILPQLILAPYEKAIGLNNN